jgi:hypothetical protein
MKSRFPTGMPFGAKHAVDLGVARAMRSKLRRHGYAEDGKFNALTEDAGVIPPIAPGLGLKVNEAVLGEPESVWG